MDIIDSITTLIKNLKTNHCDKTPWLVRPYIVGYKVDYALVNDGILINNTHHLCEFINFTNPSNFNDSGKAVISLNNQFIKSKRVNSDFVIENLTKIEFLNDPYKTIKESYIFSLDGEGVLPKIPYLSTHYDIYSVLNSLNAIDRNITVTDWSVNGIIIKNDRFAMRYIKKPFESISCISDITHHIDINGGVYNIAYFNPISFNGLIVIKSVLKSKKIPINIGDIVTVRIKPQGNHKGDIQSIVYPCPFKKEKIAFTNCPYCNSVLFKKGSKSELYCPNNLCSGVLIKKIVYWCNKDSMDIKGIGEKMATHLIANKIVTTIDELYKLTINDLSKINGTLYKSAQNIIQKINESKNAPLKKVISSLGIEGFNSRYSKILAWKIDTLDNLLNITKEALSVLPLKQSNAVIDYVKKESNKVLIANLCTILNAKAPIIKSSNHPFVNKSFKIIGYFPTYNREDIEKILTKAGIFIDTNSTTDCYRLYCQKKSISKRNTKNITFFKLLNYILD